MLTATIKAAVAQAFAAAGDTLKDIEYHSVSTGAYTISTDSQILNETVVDAEGLMYNEKIETQDFSKIDLIQTKVLMEGKWFTALAQRPSEEDYLVIEGIKYEIKNVEPTPQDIAFIFIVRAV